MSQLSLLKSLLGEDLESDEVLEFYLDSASDIICEIRCSDVVEPKYRNIQVRIAIELLNKRGAEGQTAHDELGIGRTYEKADVSSSLLSNITPVIRTPFSSTRIV